MSTPTFVPPAQVGLPPEAAQPVVAEVQYQQAQISAAQAAAIAAVLVIWAPIDVPNPFGWWFRGGANSPAERAFTVVSMAQEAAAATAREYVLRAMAAQGHLVAADDVDPIRYAGHAADGSTLEKELEQAVWAVRRAVRRGATPDEARAAGASLLTTIVQGEVNDAAREAAAAVVTSGRVLEVSPRATEPTEAGRDTLEREVRAQLDVERNTARVLRDAERVLRDEALRQEVRARALEEETKRERQARRAADEAARVAEQARRAADRTRQRAEEDVLAEAERILREADEREAVREAERIARFAARREGRGPRKQYELGWIRVLTPPSCGRCIVLAGRWYRYSAAFQRHPHCDCLQVPCTVAGQDNLVTDPQQAFDAMSPAEQDKAFGAAQAEALRLGADMSQVVNAYGKGQVFAVDGRQYTRASTTKRGSYRFTDAGRAGALRATPTTLIQEAGEDREEARRLLRRFGYLRD